MRALSMILIAVFLAGCAALGPGNEQGKAGLNIVRAEFQIPEGVAGPKYIEAYFGKESEDVALQLDLKDLGSATFTSKGTKAFEAVKARAALEKAVSADLAGATENLAPTILELILGVPGL